MVCENTDCLPLWRWNPHLEVPASSETSWQSGVGNFLYFWAGFIWNLTSAAVEFSGYALTETAVLADRVAVWIWESVPAPVHMLIGALIIGSLFLPSKKQSSYIRTVTRRVLAAGVVLGLFFSMAAAALRDVQAGEDTPAQSAGSPSWAIKEIAEWGDFFLTDAVYAVSEAPAAGDNSNGVLNCREYDNVLLAAAETEGRVTFAELASDRLWRRVFYSSWADTSYADAAGEVSCVVAEWQSGASVWEIRQIACHATAGAAAWSERGECEWSDIGLPEPEAGLEHLVWQPPVARSQTGRVATPWYVCSRRDGLWRANPETSEWGSLLTVKAELSFSPPVVAEACEAWWDSTLPANFRCSEEGNQLLCSPNLLTDRVDPSELKGGELDQYNFVAAVDVLRPELGDSLSTPEWANVADAASTHELWSSPVSADSTSNRTVRALAGRPANVLTAGFLAAANAMFYGPVVAGSVLAVTVGGVMILLGLALLPLAGLGWAMEGQPRVVAEKAVNLIKRGLLVWVGGFAVLGVLLAVLFIMSDFVDANDDVREEQLFLFMLGSVFWAVVLMRFRRGRRGRRFSFRGIRQRQRALRRRIRGVLSDPAGVEDNEQEELLEEMEEELFEEELLEEELAAAQQHPQGNPQQRWRRQTGKQPDK